MATHKTVLNYYEYMDRTAALLPWNSSKTFEYWNMFDRVLRELIETNYVPRGVKNHYRFNFETREVQTWRTYVSPHKLVTEGVPGGFKRAQSDYLQQASWTRSRPAEPTAGQLNLQPAGTMLPVAQCNAVWTDNWHEKRRLGYFCSKAHRQRPTGFENLWAVYLRLRSVYIAN